MIPIRDTNPSRSVPFVNYTLIGLNVVVFLFEITLGRNLGSVIGNFGVVPARIVSAMSAYSFEPAVYLTFISSMFLHGGWMHLLGNMVFLHVFGDNVEDRFGHARYLLFYLLAGAAAAASQIFINPDSVVPMVGASGAIAGILGAYVIMYPRARVLTLIPIFFFIQFIELPAFIFLGLWFLMQLSSGVLSLNIGGDAGGVAWWAHIGGFAAGALLLPLLKKRS
jgi:membrane associated rhomboid family serine protease